MSSPKSTKLVCLWEILAAYAVAQLDRPQDKYFLKKTRLHLHMRLCMNHELNGSVIKWYSASFHSVHQRAGKIHKTMYLFVLHLL